MESIASLITMWALIEGLIEYTNMIFIGHKVQWQVITSIVIGIVVCFSFNVDMSRYLGIEAPIPYAGVILTGIVGSRGSNYAHDLLKRIKT